MKRRPWVTSFSIGLLVALGACGDSSTDPPAPVATTVAVSPATLTFSSFGETQQLTATVLDQDGDPMNGAFHWFSSDSLSVASVSSTGLVTAVANGTATITASSFTGPQGSALVDVVVFYRAANGVTVLCPDASVGSIGSVDGVEYTKRSRNGIEELVSASNYAPLATTCTSDVTDMSFLFEGAFAFDEAIGSWDVSSVTNLEGMFTDAVAFNGAIGSWDVSGVTTTEGMFFGAVAFNQPVGSWDVGRVTDMSGMFRRADAFNQDISAWDVSSVRTLDTMFLDATSFDQAIGSWDVSNVNDMGWMFFNASAFNQDLSGWCVTQIPVAPTSFSAGATSWLLPLPVWGTCP